MLKVLLAFIAFLMSIFAYGQQNYQITENKIDAIFKDIKDTNPGVSLAILKNNKVIIQKNYGLANLEYQIPITNKTVFHAASVSKQFTVFALLLLEADGKLSLDDDVRKYIPELNGFNHKITLRNLANHTSGIKDQHNLGRLAGWNSSDIITNDQVLNLLYHQKSLNFSPNEQFMYSNSGYTLLAEVISRVSKKPFHDFVKERIFTPLGMNQSQFVNKSESLIKNKAYAYYSKNGKYQKDLFLNSSVGATNLSTTVNDLSKWSKNFSEHTIGNKSIFKKMKSLQPLNNGKRYGYGLGLFINKYKGIQKIEHSGIDASYQAYIGWFPKQKLSIIYLSNNGDLNGGRNIYKITNLLLDKYATKTAAKRKLLSKKIITNHYSISELKKYEGYYWNSKERFSRQLKVENDKLNYIGGDGKSTSLSSVNKDEFQFNAKTYTGVIIKEDTMRVILDDGYVLNFEKYTPANHTKKTIEKYLGSYYSNELNTFYTFYAKENNLIANHQRTGDFKLESISNDFFIGNKGSFRNVKFTRNKKNKITGFYVSSSRAKNILFKKVKI